MKLLIIQSEFNKNLVEQLYKSALKGFEEYTNFSLDEETNGKPTENQNSSQIKNPFDLQSIYVPGAGEIPQATHWSLSQESELAGILALGVIIRGETPHFDFLSRFLQTALWDLQKSYFTPLVFSVLMLENRDQFQKRIIRASEAMKALLKMIDLEIAIH